MVCDVRMMGSFFASLCTVVMAALDHGLGVSDFQGLCIQDSFNGCGKFETYMVLSTYI